MPNFRWSSKPPGALDAGIPGRKFRIAAFLIIVLACWFAAGSIGLAWSAIAVVLIAPEIVELWLWFVGKAMKHAVQRDERIYRFGYTDVRMLMAHGRPWFAAADICSALGLADVDQEIKHFRATKCGTLGGWNERYLSEAGVMSLIGRSRHPDARSFRIWFEREVMFSLTRARESREQERKARNATRP